MTKKEHYTTPTLASYGSIASLTLQKTGSDIDGQGGAFGGDDGMDMGMGMGMGMM